MASDMSEPAPPQFLQGGFPQIGIVVKDLDAAVEHYWNVLGIGPWHFYTYGAPLVKRMSYRGRPAKYLMRIAVASHGPLRIELIQPLEGETVYAEFVRDHGYGIHHLGFVVPDIRKALEEAASAGLEMTMDGSGFGLDGDGRYAYLDTENLFGTTFELIERPKRRVTPEKIYPQP